MRVRWRFNSRENIILFLLIAILIGLAAGALAVGFRFLLLATEFFWSNSGELLAATAALPWYQVLLTPVLGGLLIAPVIARWAPETRGAGVPEVIEAVVTREGIIHHRTTFFKTLSTVISIGSGASVGREGPIVHIGSSVGSSIAQLLGFSAEWRRVFLACLTAGIPAYALVGMGAVVSGATLAPITALFTIFELTYNFDIILPLMTCCIASLVVVQRFYGHSIYETKLLKKGIRIVRGHDVNLLRAIRVGDFMERKFEMLRDDTRLGEMLVRTQESHYPHFLVLNRQDELVGILAMRDIKAFLAEVGDLIELVVASDIMTKNVHCLNPDDSFETAFEVFEGKQISTLPVVDPVNPLKVRGILKKSSLLLAYNQKILKTDLLKKISS